MTGEGVFAEVRMGSEKKDVPVPDRSSEPGTLKQDEAFRIEHDRVVRRRASIPGGAARLPSETVGLALSGGGIRSATFSLGIIRALGRSGLIPSVDYLSTVSGGSYIGAFLGSRYVPQKLRGDLVEDDVEQFIGGAGDPLEGAIGDKAFEHLRQSGRHLLPGSTGDGFRIAIILSRNWIAIQTVLGCTLLAAYFFLKPFQAFWLLCPGWKVVEAGWAAQGLPPWLWPTSWLMGYPIKHWLIASPLLPVSAFLFLCVVAANWAYFHARGNPRMAKSRIRRLFGPSLWIVVVAVLVGIHLTFQVTWICSWLAGLGSSIPGAPGLGVVLGAVALASLVVYIAAEFLDWRDTHDNPHRPKSWIRQHLGPSLLIIFVAASVTVLVTVHLQSRATSMHVPLPGLDSSMKDAGRLGIVLIALAGLFLLFYVAAHVWDCCAHGGAGDQPVAEMPLAQEDRVRARITGWAAFLLKFAVLILVLGILDTLAQTIYTRAGELWVPASLGAVAAVAAPAFRQLLTSLPKLATGKSKVAALARRSGRTLALVAGLLLFSIIALFWAVVAHYLAWRGGPIASVETWVDQDKVHLPDYVDAAIVLAIVAIAFLAVAVAIALSFAFLNLSTYSHFYSTRLRRAYLGASNTDRYKKGFDTHVVDADEANDDIGIDRYYDPRVRGPVHLIQITINDTASGSSNTVQRDRRGKPLTISPAGFLFPQASPREEIVGLAFPDRKDAAAVKRGPDLLPLSGWVGLSGAAASTGMGQYGSLGLSLLTGLSNLRLGQWWDPGAAALRLSKAEKKENRLRNLVQLRFVDELLGKFPGTDGRRWYLTDGGHFENTGVYELVRRRVAFIIMCDNGADAEYQFADLVTLTRRIKIDFDAELSFLNESELDLLLGPRTKVREAFGNLEALAVESKGDPRLGPYAALGRIKFERDPAGGVYQRRESTLLLIKPRICGTEATDLAAYAKANPPFPQQSTLDQFYDEAQWESYYRLGLLIGEKVFADPDVDRWSAARLSPLPT